MIPRLHRIDGATLKRILPQSKTLRMSWGSLRLYPNNSEVKVTCIVSKKSAKLSPDRHRIKRKIYTIIAEILPTLKPGYYILFPHPTALNTKLDELRSSIQQSFRKFTTDYED